jgi:S-adenosylmethionine:tRNA-ribosyltransferase-isomerase (queuine synthetase)
MQRHPGAGTFPKIQTDAVHHEEIMKVERKHQQTLKPKDKEIGALRE